MIVPVLGIVAGALMRHAPATAPAGPGLAFVFLQLAGSWTAEEIREQDGKGLVYCWDAEFTRELCCGEAAPDCEFAFEGFVVGKGHVWLGSRFTKEECCGSDFAIVDPYFFTWAPPVTFPRGESWAAENPAVAQEQLDWEERVRHAAVTKFHDVFVVGSEAMAGLTLRVFKGDVSDFAYEPRVDLSGTRVLVDIGAHYGHGTSIMAAALPFARVIAFEPDPLRCRFLLWNLRENGLHGRVWPVCAGISDAVREGWIDPCTDMFRGFEESCSSMSQTTKASGRVGVPLVTLASALLALRIDSAAVDIVKIDCEGCEWRTRLPQNAEIMGELHFMHYPGDLSHCPTSCEQFSFEFHNRDEALRKISECCVPESFLLG